MSRIVAVCLLLACTFVAADPPVKPDSLPGIYYSRTETERNGTVSVQHGSATITLDKGGYVIASTSNGISVWGFAVKRGNFLAVSWQIATPNHEGPPGVSIYEIKGKGVLEGEFLQHGDKQPGRERLELLKAFKEEKET